MSAVGPTPPPPPPATAAPPPPPAPDDPAAVTGGPPARVAGLTCPSCGGVLEVDAGVRVAHCRFCSATLLVSEPEGVRRFAVDARHDASEARGAVGRWLGSGWNKDRRLPREAELGEAFLCFLPFFRVEADVIGWAFGTEERTRTTGSGKSRRTEHYEVDVERSSHRHFDRTLAAVNVAELGVEQVRLAGDRLLPFDGEALERRGMVFAPTRSETEARESALAGFREDADPAAGMKRVRFRFLETVREAVSVVYYPLWVVRYRFRDRSYQAVIDAEDGSLAYGKAPGNDLYRALVLVGTEALLCYLGSTVIQLADDACGALAGAAVVGSLFLAWAWRRFRYGGVVEEGSGVRRTTAPAPALLRRWWRR